MTRSHGSQTTFLAAPQSHAFYTQMKKNGQVLRPRRVMDHAAAVKQIELYCVAHPGSPSFSAIYPWRALGRFARTDPGRRNSRYRFYCCGGASRVRRAIFGWSAAADEAIKPLASPSLSAPP